MLEPLSNRAAPVINQAPSQPTSCDRRQTPSVLQRLIGNAGPAARRSLVAALRALIIGFVLMAVTVTVPLLILRVVNPPTSMLMLGERLMGRPVNQRWVSIGAISPTLQRAVILSEDGQFCRHHGVDVAELKAALHRVEVAGEAEGRGASTITMQVAKNLFLWPQRSVIRKGLEVALALAIERVWTKRRILEVYLNIAEWGPGVFGAEAAARLHFRKSALRLSEAEAQLLAVSLPNPRERVAGRPGPGTRRLAGLLDQRIKQSGASHTACLE